MKFFNDKGEPAKDGEKIAEIEVDKSRILPPDALVVLHDGTFVRFKDLEEFWIKRHEPKLGGSFEDPYVTEKPRT